MWLTIERLSYNSQSTLIDSESTNSSLLPSCQGDKPILIDEISFQV